MIAALSFLLKISVGATIHQPFAPDQDHPQISSSRKLLILCLVRPDLLNSLSHEKMSD